ncbi:hypothetical protein [Croceicoccus sediminis]|uniref:hypothetical protein n=1 Tax=Croceicoccus sediminis TaxID=2571150 RepID=UPI0011837F3B|nr:hypothetical protein [Croceicoccus sediminis]
MKKFLIAGTATVMLAFATPALAHGSVEPMHGGMVVEMAGETVVELVKTSQGMDVYFNDGHAELPAASFDANLIVTPAAGKKFTAELKPASGNRLTAAGVKAAAGTKVVVAVLDKSTGIKSFATFRY